MKEPADFGNEYWFVGEEGGRVVRVDFDDVRIVVVKTAMKIECVDAVEYGVGEDVVSRGGHTL